MIAPTGDFTTAQLTAMREMRDHIDAVLDAHEGELPWWATAAGLDKAGAIDVASRDFRAAHNEIEQLDTADGIVAAAANTPVVEVVTVGIAAMLDQARVTG